MKIPKKIGVLALVSVLAIVGISLMKNAPELEDAEQAFYSQWWRWGYDDQPPLYTWLQLGLNKILGVSKVSFSLLRGVLFAAILLVLYRFAYNFRKNEAQAFSVVLALVLLPTFIDFTFRRLSHTTLLCLAVLLTYYMVQRLIKAKSLRNYLLLGVVLGVGLLAKYNFVLVLAAFGVAFFFNSELKKVVLHRNFVLTIGVTILLFIPHLNWLLSDASFVGELQTSVSSKAHTEAETGIPVLTPLLSFVVTILKLVWPLLLVVLVMVFKKSIKPYKIEKEQQWLWHVCIAQGIVLLGVFVLMNVQKVEARWLLPLCIPFLLLFSNYFSNAILLKWNKIGFVVFLCILGLQIIRTPIEKAFSISSSVHYGFEEISKKLRKNYADKQWVLPDVTYAGSIRLLNKERNVFSLDDFSLPAGTLNRKQCVFVVKDAIDIPEKAVVSDTILRFGKYEENLYFYRLGN